jgi:hypothetical protein
VNPNKSKIAFKTDRTALVLIFAREGLDEQAVLITAGEIPKVHKIPVGPPL